MINEMIRDALVIELTCLDLHNSAINISIENTPKSGRVKSTLFQNETFTKYKSAKTRKNLQLKLKPNLSSYREDKIARMNLQQYFECRDLTIRENTRLPSQLHKSKPHKQSKPNTRSLGKNRRIDLSHNFFHQRIKSSYEQSRITTAHRPMLENNK